MTDAAVDIDLFLEGYDPAVAQLAQALRRAVRDVVPDADETLHGGWKVISYGLSRKFCAIAPHNNWVNLQFHAGAQLDDPAGLLTGTGKSMRHVRIVPEAGIPTGLAALLQVAADKAA